MYNKGSAGLVETKLYVGPFAPPGGSVRRLTSFVVVSTTFKYVPHVSGKYRYRPSGWKARAVGAQFHTMLTALVRVSRAPSLP